MDGVLEDRVLGADGSAHDPEVSCPDMIRWEGGNLFAPVIPGPIRQVGGNLFVPVIPDPLEKVHKQSFHENRSFTGLLVDFILPGAVPWHKDPGVDIPSA